MLDLVETLRPYFEKAFGYNPEGAMAAATWFAAAHGHSELEDLPDAEVQHLCVLLEGLSLPIHPSDMTAAGKYGCGVCKEFYKELWGLQFAPILEAMRSDDYAPPDPRDLASDQWAALRGKVEGSSKYLRES